MCVHIIRAARESMRICVDLVLCERARKFTVHCERGTPQKGAHKAEHADTCARACTCRRFVLEDASGSVPLDLSQAVTTAGFFTGGCAVPVHGCVVPVHG